jgi:hypothetical protein
MVQLSEGGTAKTQGYWDLAVETENCPNWIAKWFLYHKFRYRDGRNKPKSSHKESSNGHRRSSGNSEYQSSSWSEMEIPHREQRHNQTYYRQASSRHEANGM